MVFITPVSVTKDKRLIKPGDIQVMKTYDGLSLCIFSGTVRG